MGVPPATVAADGRSDRRNGEGEDRSAEKGDVSQIWAYGEGIEVTSDALQGVDGREERITGLGASHVPSPEDRCDVTSPNQLDAPHAIAHVHAPSSPERTD